MKLPFVGLCPPIARLVLHSLGLFLAHSVLVVASGTPDSDYALFPSVLDGGGGRMVSQDYSAEASIDGWTSPGPIPEATLLGGYPAQLNQPPVIQPVVRTVPANGAVALPLSDLLAAASDPDGDTVRLASVAGTSERGAAATQRDGVLYYEASAGSPLPDSVSFWVQDEWGDATMGIVLLIVGTEPVGAPIQILEVRADAGAGPRVIFKGTPGALYRLQRTESLTPPIQWSPAGSLRAGPDGTLEFQEAPVVSEGARFYRALVP